MVFQVAFILTRNIILPDIYIVCLCVCYNNEHGNMVVNIPNRFSPFLSAVFWSLSIHSFIVIVSFFSRWKWIKYANVGVFLFSFFRFFLSDVSIQPIFRVSGYYYAAFIKFLAGGIFNRFFCLFSVWNYECVTYQ